MYIAIDDEEITPRNFIVHELYGIETFFCWDVNKLVLFSYRADESTARDIRILSTPAIVRRVQCFNGRIFIICAPQGIYKLSRAGVFAVLSKNALGMGAEYCEVLVDNGNGIYLDNKQTKSSRLLFQSYAIKEVCTFSLILEDTEKEFFKCFTLASGDELLERNPCVIGYDRKLFALTGNAIQLIYTTDGAISDIAHIKRGNKVAGLLVSCVNVDTMILIHGKNGDLIFEKVRLAKSARDVITVCAAFSLLMDNVLWIVYCDRYKLHYARKELFVDVVREASVEERAFACLRHYRSNVILGLSEKKELIQLSLEALESTCLSIINNNTDLHINMFQRTDLIMEEICKKAKQLDELYEKLENKQDKLRRINLYACKRKLQINPRIEISRIWNYLILNLNIPEKLPKNCYVVFALISKSQSTFCAKKVTEKVFTMKVPVDKNKILHSSIICMDLITLMNKENPWCLIRDFVNCPLQKEVRKRGKKKDRSVFINTKIALLQNLIAKSDLNMTKLYEIKKIIRAEL